MWRVAALRKSFEGSTRFCLDVCVVDSFFEKREDAAAVVNGPGNTGDHRVTGRITFQDERSSNEIVKDFALRYPANFDTGVDSTHRCTFASYIPQYHAFLVQAFVNYFSDSSRQ